MLCNKTYGDIRQSYDKFCLIGKNRKVAKEYLKISHEEDNVYVIEKCVIPELHVLQVVAKNLFWIGIVPLLVRALIWPKKLKLVANIYHGNIFKGNACRLLLKESDKLLNPEVLGKCG